MATDRDGGTFPKLVAIACLSEFGIQLGSPTSLAPGAWIYMPRIHALTLLPSK